MARTSRWIRWTGSVPHEAGFKSSWSMNLNGLGYPNGTTIQRTRGRAQMWTAFDGFDGGNYQQILGGVWGYWLVWADGSINPQNTWTVANWQFEYPTLNEQILWSAASGLEPVLGDPDLSPNPYGYRTTDSAQRVDSHAQRLAQSPEPLRDASMWLVTWQNHDFWQQPAGAPHRVTWTGEQLVLDPEPVP